MPDEDDRPEATMGIDWQSLAARIRAGHKLGEENRAIVESIMRMGPGPATMKPGHPRLGAVYTDG